MESLDQAVLLINRQGCSSHCISATWFGCGRIWFWFNCWNDYRDVASNVRLCAGFWTPAATARGGVRHAVVQKPAHRRTCELVDKQRLALPSGSYFIRGAATSFIPHAVNSQLCCAVEPVGEGRVK
jgi:hypothetical protein